MATIKKRYKRFQATVRIPKPLRDDYGGSEFLYRTLKTSSLAIAKAEAMAWEAGLRQAWALRLENPTGAATQSSPIDATPIDATAKLRQIYVTTRQEALDGVYRAQGGDENPIVLGINLELDRMADENPGYQELTPSIAAKVAALNDAQSEVLGLNVAPRQEFEPSFGELAVEYMRSWKTQRSLKKTNTPQQKEATFRLFGGYFRNRTIRQVRRRDVVEFVEFLRRMDPQWARSPAAKAYTWEQLQRSFGGRETGLSDATVNRHVAALQSLWRWAEMREYCEGTNPFDGFHRQLRTGVNVDGYLPWENEELARLWSPVPKRSDLLEVTLVAMFTGMRLDEIASMEAQQVRHEGGIPYINITDAKTPAGVRKVPIHPVLTWLVGRSKTVGQGALWSTFNPEGPGAKRGADAGKEFTRHKQSAGFHTRNKAFHSFRKNVTQQMERAQVAEGEWAQILGHERGFTYGRYNPHGVELARAAEIIAKIEYPGLLLPTPLAESRR